MQRFIAAVVISLVAGFALGAWITGEEVEPVMAPPAAPADAVFDQSAPLNERLTSLEQVVAEEREARLILEDQLQMLLGQIERVGAVDPRAAAEREQRREERARQRESQRDFVAMAQSYQERRLNRLVEGGFSEDSARRLLQQESAAQFKALQAAHDAQRNGESLDPLATMNGPQSLLRAELGDSAYEQYLEAQGQPTAIQITQVLDGSPGSQAGLQPGDEIISYNGERIFNVSELRNQTMQGTPGEDVIVEIDRDGVRMQLGLQRGPVGITGSGANIRTMNWWGGG